MGQGEGKLCHSEARAAQDPGRGTEVGPVPSRLPLGFWSGANASSEASRGRSCCSRDSEETGKVECGGLGAEFDMGGPISWKQPGTNGTGSTWWQVVGTPVTHTDRDKEREQ